MKLTGFEKRFCSDWEDWDEIGSGLQFVGCKWTKYTDDLLDGNSEEYDVLFICPETSKLEFFHKESSSKNKIFNYQIEVTSEERGDNDE